MTSLKAGERTLVRTAGAFTCASRVQYGSARCDQARLRADALEEAVLTNVLANLRDTRVVRRSMEKALQGFDSVHPKLQREFDGARRKLKETQAAIDKYLRAFETGSMSPDVCGPRLAELYGLLLDLERRRDEQEIQLSAKEALPDFGSVSAAAAHWAEELESADMPLFKHLFGTLVPEILVESRSNIRPVIHLPRVRVVCHSVGQTPHNANPKVRLECGPLREEIPDERSAPADADRRSELQKRRLREPAYREASLRGLAKATEACSWSDEAIVEAIRSFYRKLGRPPKQAEFRSIHGLPGYGTVWRRFGSARRLWPSR